MTSTTRQQAGTSILTTSGDRELRVERVFNAPRDKVWRAFTEPDLIARWWGRGNKLEIERFELRKGGHWRFLEHHAGGSDGFEGRFREVTPKERISRTFEWDGTPGHVVVETAVFEDLGDGRTRIVETSMFFTRDDRDGMVQSGMEKGMDESFAALDRLLATL